MEAVISRLLERLGQEAWLEHGGERRRLRAFLQHFGSKSWRSMERTMGALGEIPQGQYVYIGPAYPRPEAGDTLHCGGKEYVLRRAETVWFRSRPLYCWGLCIEGGGDGA